MAFRKRRFSRPGRRPLRRRSFSRGKFARQKFDRIVLFSNLNVGLQVPQPVGGENVNGNTIFTCSPLEVGGCSKRALPDPFCGPDTICGTVNNEPVECACCTNQVNFTLINNDTLESYYQDSVTLVRTYGDIYFRAIVASPFNEEYCTLMGQDLRLFNTLYRTSYAEQWHWSVRKHLRSQADSAAGELSPFDAASPGYSYDWTESSPPWLWQRFKMWYPRNERMFWSKSRDSVYGICSDVSGGATNIVPPIASGSQPGYIIDTNVSTDCTIVAPDEGGICPEMFAGEKINEPPWHHMRFRLRKHVKMQRDQDLNLICQVRHPAISIAGGWPCIPDDAFGPRFTRGGDVSYQFYVRIAAVVRLN